MRRYVWIRNGGESFVYISLRMETLHRDREDLIRAAEREFGPGELYVRFSRRREYATPYPKVFRHPDEMVDK